MSGTKRLVVYRMVYRAKKIKVDKNVYLTLKFRSLKAAESFSNFFIELLVVHCNWIQNADAVPFDRIDLSAAHMGSSERVLYDIILDFHIYVLLRFLHFFVVLEFRCCCGCDAVAYR